MLLHIPFVYTEATSLNLKMILRYYKIHWSNLQNIDDPEKRNWMKDNRNIGKMVRTKNTIRRRAAPRKINLYAIITESEGVWSEMWLIWRTVWGWIASQAFYASCYRLSISPLFYSLIPVKRDTISIHPLCLFPLAWFITPRNKPLRLVKLIPRHVQFTFAYHS